jgi:hypothetical protein
MSKKSSESGALVMDATSINEEPSKATEETTLSEQFAGDSDIALPSTAGSAPITSNDIILPTLRLAHNVGSLGEEFQKGSYVVDGSTQITQFNPKENKSTQVDLTVLDFQKSYIENVPWGDDRTAEVLMSEQAVTQKGMSFNYWTDDNGNKQEPHYWPTLKLRVLVKRPKNKIPNIDGELEEVNLSNFPYHFGDDDYAMVAWTLQRSGYTRAGRRILSAFHNKVFECCVCGVFKLSSTLSSFGSNKTFVPEIQYGVKNEDAFVSWASSL